jgi:hypothetical protein
VWPWFALPARHPPTTSRGHAHENRGRERCRGIRAFILTDNLGYGEVGAYGGGLTRGAATPRIDSLAKEGMRFLNMNMETQCTPSRSSLMTGRWAIRSGTHSVPFGGVADGLTQWEVTIGEALSDAGYATGYYGKWHLGSHDGRLPNDQGFDEWFGIPRTTDEALWPAAGWSPGIMPSEKTMECRNGEKRRDLPTLPNPAFAGEPGNGDWADMLAEIGARVSTQGGAWNVLATFLLKPLEL